MKNLESLKIARPAFKTTDQLYCPPFRRKQIKVKNMRKLFKNLIEILIKFKMVLVLNQS